MTESDFGSLLRRYRVAAGLTQEALAERAGISTRGVSDLERGIHGLPRKDTLHLLLDALALAPADRAALIATSRRLPKANTRRTRAERHPDLPIPPTSLIGRDQEIDAVAARLAVPTIRLLTLTGPGGTGKTRLALAVAERAAPSFPDGVIFVDLAPLSDPSLVVSAIANQLGVRVRAGQPLRDALITHLVGKRLLLILDNFEHLLPAAASVAALLRACPALWVMTTSRAPLRLSGEHLYPVAPLALPDAGPLPPVEELGHIAAVRLFVERARAVNPDFDLRDANASTVVEIVRRVDGLPLALELVAARIRAITPGGLAVRLNRSLPLLTGGAQDLPERQRTLRETIGWSYDLLRPEDQALFRRLGAFASGCTLEAAEAVSDLDAPFPVLEGVTALLDASLLQIEELEDKSRYRMLSTIREFALERLLDSGDALTTQDRHAHYFRDLVESAHPYIVTGNPIVFDTLDPEHDNVRAALEWSRQTSDHDTLLRLAGALTGFWYSRGDLNEAQRWLSQALQTPVDTGMPRPRALALAASGMLASVCGETDRAITLLTESFAWWEQSGDRLGSALASSLLGGVYVSQGRFDEAGRIFTTTEAYYRDDPALPDVIRDDFLAHTRFHLGLIAWVQGDVARARSLLQDAVTRCDRAGVPTDAIDSLRYLGLIACVTGNLDDAVRWLREEWTRLRLHRSRAAFAVGLADVATLAAARQAWQPALRLFAKAEALLQIEAAAFTLPAHEHYERAQARATTALGDSAEGVAAAGRALTLEQALEEAEAVLAKDQTASAESTSMPDLEREQAPRTE